MTIIPQEKLLERWDALPPILKEAVFSEINSDFVWSTCAAENLPEEKAPVVMRSMGYVLMGFLHPEDVAQELKAELTLDPQTAKAIEDALNKRIFAPLRADIDKVYAPMSKFEESTIGTGPKILNDISVTKKIPSAPASAPIPAPASAPVAPKPITLSDVGWSKTPPSALTPRVGATPPVPTPAPKPAPSMGGVAPAPVPAPRAEPAPMILHEDTSFKAVEKNAGFTLSRPGGGAEMKIERNAVPAPTRPAVLEFGGIKPPATPNKSVSSPVPNNYTSGRPPLSATPTADAGPRNVTQIMPAAPRPPAPPAPSAPSAANVPMPPTPPQQPAPPQNGKPIVKDFL